MRILLIGGTSYLGPVIVHRALKQGHDVAVFHRGRTHTSLDADVPHIHGDTIDLSQHRREIEAFGPDAVIDNTQILAETTSSVIEGLKGLAERYVVASSGDVYRGYGVLHRTEPGPIQPMPVKETDELRTLPSFDQTETADKIIVERTALSQSELPATAVRAPGIFGPRDPVKRVSGPMKKMEGSGGVLRMSTGRAGFLWGLGFLYDIVDALILCAADRRPGHSVYNVGYNRVWTTLEWYQMIARAMGWNGTISVEDDAPDDWDINFEQGLYGDTSRIRQELGYSESFTLGEALDVTVQWEREQIPDRLPGWDR